MPFQVEEKEVNQLQAFATDYMSHFSKVSSFFHYSPFEEKSYLARLQELKQRRFPRKEISQIIRTSMSKWGMNEQIDKHLHQLEQPDSVVVIGGQQAGLLTGPLYTMYKMITILQLAKQKSKVLGVPVIPIFWIAGEDHDYAEINHIFIPRAESTLMDKHMLPMENTYDKTPVAYLPFPKHDVVKWLKVLFSQLSETEYTNNLKEIIEKFVTNSDSFVDFFVQVSHYLFQEYGMLFINSADPQLRRLESHGYCTILHHYEEIDQKVRETVLRMERLGYPPQVEIGELPALLFILKDGERKLLEKTGTTSFQTKDGQYTFQLEELLEIAENSPEILSNNVITRPYMQEILFPTLAFVGGPGEISYWALYKDYFEHLGITLPILTPRISITLIEKPIEKIIQRRNIPMDCIFGEFESFKADWLKQQDHINIEASFAEVKERIEQLHTGLLQKLSSIPGIDQLGPKNLEKILEQVEFLEKRSISSFVQQHEVAMRQFDKVEQALYPQQKLQERVHNPVPFINKHGKQLIHQLMELPLEVNGKHKLIYI